MSKSREPSFNSGISSSYEPESFIEGNDVSLHRISDLLELPAGTVNAIINQDSPLLTAVALFKDGIRLQLSFFNEEPLSVWIRPHGVRPCFLSNLKLDFSFEGDSSSPMTQEIIQKIALRLNGIPFELLRTFIEKDEFIVNQNSITSDRPSVSTISSSPSIRKWGHPDQWREFCAYEYIHDNTTQTILGQFSFVGPTVCLRHGELECQFTMIDGCPGGILPNPLKFFQHPVPVVDDERPHSDYYMTFLNERDVVLGSGIRKVRRIFDFLSDKDTCNYIEFKNCCIPMMIGDDVKTAIRDFEQKSGKPVFFEDMDGSREEKFLLNFKKQLSLSSTTTLTASNRLYNLIGFPEWRKRGELTETLSEMGAELNITLMPEFDPRSLGRLRTASVQMILPNRYYSHISDILRALPLKTLDNSAPFGVEGTRHWLTMAASLFGGEIQSHASSVIERRWSMIEEMWNVLTKEARTYRMAFILGMDDNSRLFDMYENGGLIIPSLLDEMGFKIDFVYYTGNSLDDVPKDNAPFTRLPGFQRHRSLQFTNQEELNSILRDMEINAVYSNFNFDRRLSSNGLAGFSMMDFHMGFDGALKTLERLVEICRMPFYRRYRSHLTSDTE